MTKKQKAFFDYLQKLEGYNNPKFITVALSEFYKYWKKYEKDGIKDSMTVAMESTEAFIGLPVTVHLN